MKNYLLLFTCLVFLFSCETNTESLSEEEHHKEVPTDWFYNQRAYPEGQIDKQAYFNALKYRRSALANSSTRTINQEWEFAGPDNIGGRITDIEMPADDLNTMYIGAASGGVFKSTDGGTSFEPVFDDALNLSIGDIALAPSNSDILYVGTGEANAGGGSLAYDGLGVYRSDDAGENWTSIGLEDAGSIGKVIIHPTDPNTVYVGTMGNLFANDGQRGVFKTTDGGQSWDHVLMVSDSTGVIDMAMHPDNPNTIYAASWERIRRPQYRNYGGPTSGIFRSTDGGANWTELTNGLPITPENKGRIGIAIAPSNPDVLYAAYAGASGSISGAYRSNNGGDTWVTINTDGVDNVGFMWWFGKIIVHPEDPDKVYYLSLRSFASDNSGDDWVEIFSGQHVDQHALFIHPADPDFFVSGNDGGVYLSPNEGLSYSKVNNLPITQFYGMDIDEQLPERLYGGTQDNGTWRTADGSVDNWEYLSGGDGMNPMVSPLNSDRIYTGSQYGYFRRSDNGGLNFYNATNGIDGNDRFNWNTPKEFDPTDPEIMYYGTNRLYKSTDGALNWSPISPDLTNGSGGGNLTYGTITTISASAVNGDVVWIGTDDGRIWVTENGGSTWTSVPTSSNRWVTRVAADPTLANVAYSTLSGYRYGEDIGHVYRTSNYGISWIDITGNLPDIPVNDIIINPVSGHLYLATDIGVFVSFSNGNEWELLGTGLPNVVVTDLDFHEGTNTLVAATYGRSMYKIDVEDITSINPLVLDINRKVYPNPFQSECQLSIQIKERDQYTISIFDSQGKIIQALFKGQLTAGSHQFNIAGHQLPTGLNFGVIENSQGQKSNFKLLHLD